MNQLEQIPSLSIFLGQNHHLERPSLSGAISNPQRKLILRREWEICVFNILLEDDFIIMSQFENCRLVSHLLQCPSLQMTLFPDLGHILIAHDRINKPEAVGMLAEILNTWSM